MWCKCSLPLGLFRRPQRGDINAVGEKESPERKQWVIDQINKLGDQLESGHCIGLLACPHQYQHGTLEHAHWLYSNCAEGAEVINSASGYSVFASSENPSLEEAMRRTAQGDAVSAATSRPETMKVTPLAALTHLALPPKERTNVTIYLNKCPFCSNSWFVNDAQGYSFHDCLEVRKKYLPGLDAYVQSQKALEAQRQAEQDDDNWSQS